MLVAAEHDEWVPKRREHLYSRTVHKRVVGPQVRHLAQTKPLPCPL